MRLVALLLLLATAAVYAGLTVPLRTKAAAASDAYRRARDDRRAARAHLEDVQRRESALRRAAPAAADPGSSPRDPVGRTRQGIVSSLEGAGLSGVRLAVKPAAAPAASLIRLGAEGAFADVVRVTDDLVRPGTGVVLEKLQLNGHDSRVAVRLDGFGLEAAR